MNSLSLTNTALLVRDLKDQENHNIRSGWISLAEGFINGGDWRPSSPADVAALSALLDHLPSSQAARVVRVLPDRILQMPPDAAAKSADQLVNAVSVASAVAESLSLPLPRVKLPAGPDVALAVAGAAAGAQALKAMSPQAGPDEIAGTIMKRVTADPEIVPLAPLFAALTEWNVGVPWDEMVKPLAELLSTANDVIAVRAVEGLAAVWAVDPSAREAVREAAGSQAAMGCLSRWMTQRDAGAAGMMIALKLLTRVLPLAPDRPWDAVAVASRS